MQYYAVQHYYKSISHWQRIFDHRFAYIWLFSIIENDLSFSIIHRDDRLTSTATQSNTSSCDMFEHDENAINATTMKSTPELCATISTLHATVDPLSPLMIAFRYWRDKLGPFSMQKSVDSKVRRQLSELSKLLASLLIVNAEVSPSINCYLCSFVSIWAQFSVYATHLRYDRPMRAHVCSPYVGVVISDNGS